MFNIKVGFSTGFEFFSNSVYRHEARQIQQ